MTETLPDLRFLGGERRIFPAFHCLELADVDQCLFVRGAIKLDGNNVRARLPGDNNSVEIVPANTLAALQYYAVAVD